MNGHFGNQERTLVPNQAPSSMSELGKTGEFLEFSFAQENIHVIN